MLEKFKFFTCFYHLCELRSRGDIIKLIIECCDYTINAHPRIVLSKALTSSFLVSCHAAPIGANLRKPASSQRTTSVDCCMTLRT